MGDPLTSGWFWGRMEEFRGSGAVVAQLLPKQWVAGSNPVSRSKSLQAKLGGFFSGYLKAIAVGDKVNLLRSSNGASR